MICPLCKHPYQDGEPYCPVCGADTDWVPGDPDDMPKAACIQGADRRRPIPLRRIVGAAVTAAVVLLAIWLGSIGQRPGDHFVLFLLGLEQDGGVYTKLFSADGEHFTISNTENADRQGEAHWLEIDEYRSLHLLTPQGQRFIATDVHYAVLSDHEDYIAYLAERDGQYANLYWYDIAKDQVVKISARVYADGCLVLSPDGKTVGYISSYNNGSYTTYYSVEGKTPVTIGAMINLLAIGDGGRHMYYLIPDTATADDGLTVRSTLYYNKDGVVTRMNRTEYMTNFIFNSDNTEITYHINGRSYVRVDGGDAIELCTGYLVPMLEGWYRKYDPVDKTNNPWSCYRYDRATLSGMYAAVLEFSETGRSNAPAIYTIDKRWNTRRIAEYQYGYLMISTDGQSMLYYDMEGQLMHVGKGAKTKTAVRGVMEHKMAAVYAGGTLRKIYFIDENNDLYYSKIGGNPKKIAENISYEDASVAFDETSGTLYFIQETAAGMGQLMKTKNGGRPVPVIKPGTDYTTGVYQSDGILYYAVSAGAEQSLYRVKNGQAELLGSSRSEPVFLDKFR